MPCLVSLSPFFVADAVRALTRNEIQELGGRCRALLYVLKDNSAKAAPENIRAMVVAAEEYVRLEGACCI